MSNQRSREEQPVIYLVDASRAYTGAFSCACGFARALLGHARVVLVIPKDNRDEFQDLTDFDEVVRLPMHNLRRSFSSVLLYFPSLLISSFLLSRRMRRDQASILIANDFYLMEVAMSRLFGFKGRIVTWVRIDPSVFGRVSSLWLWAVGKSSDRILTVSHYIKRLLPKGLDVEVIYDAIDTPSLPLVSEATSLRPTFIFVGNFILGKGQDAAVEALAIAAQEFPEVQLEFYGGDMGLSKNKDFRTSLERRAVQLGLSENIYFGGFVRDTKSLMAGKLAALNFSQSESFSMTVLEASAFGLPVIATRSGGPQEIVEDGVTGFLVPVGNVQACAKAMIEICRCPDRAKAMGAAGRRRVLSNFSPEAYKKQLLELLEIDV